MMAATRDVSLETPDLELENVVLHEVLAGSYREMGSLRCMPRCTPERQSPRAWQSSTRASTRTIEGVVVLQSYRKP